MMHILQVSYSTFSVETRCSVTINDPFRIVVKDINSVFHSAKLTIYVITIQFTLIIVNFLHGGTDSRALTRRHPIACEKQTIFEHANMTDWPFIERIIDKITASVHRVELAAQWPPIRLRFEFDANTIVHIESFLHRPLFRRRSYTYIKAHRLSLCGNLRVFIKTITDTMAADNMLKQFAEITSFVVFVTEAAIEANFFLVHGLTSPKIFFLIALYKIRSCSSA